MFITKDNVLLLRTRQKIYSSISENPGIHYSELSRKINIPQTTLLYHLRYLNKLGLIKRIKKNGYTRMYIKNTLSNQEEKILALLKEKIPCRILLQLLFSFTCSRKELSKELEIPPNTVKYYLEKMLDIGLIEKAPVENGFVYIYPAEYSKNYLLVKKRPVGREIFYRRKEYSELRVTTYKLMVSHKDSLADKELIETYVGYLDRIEETGKKLKENDDRKVIAEKDGKKKAYPLIPNIDEVCDLFLELFKPPFCA